MGQNTPAADASDAVRDEDAHLLGDAEAMLVSLGAPVFPRDQPILYAPAQPSLVPLAKTTSPGHGRPAEP